MLSDYVSGLVERHLPEFQRHLRDARLFRIDESEAKSSEEKSGVEDWSPDARVVENYRLPFDSILIECADERTASTKFCTWLWNKDADVRHFGFLTAAAQEGEAKVVTFVCSGSLTAFPNGDVFDVVDSVPFVSCADHGVRAWCFEGGKKRAPRRIEDVMPFYDLSFGLREDGSVGIKGKSADVFMEAVENRRGPEELARRLMEIDPEDREGTYKQALSLLTSRMDGIYLKMVAFALNCDLIRLLFICEPSRFVVEERPLQPLRQPKEKLPRSPWRPHFIVLEPRKIKQQLLGVDPNPPSGSTRAPHERRGHYRRLVSERFSEEKRGSVIWIRPTWVGPQEGVVGKNKYIVRLDV